MGFLINLIADENLCGPPPPPNPGLVGVAGLVAEYYCKKKEKLTGPETRTCDEETQEWSPGEEEQSICKTVQ